MSENDGDTTSLDFGIWNNTGQTIRLVNERTPNSHWHDAPPSTIADGQVGHVTAGSNSINGTDVSVTYVLADGSVRFSCQALVPVLVARNSATATEDPETDVYRTQADIGWGTHNVTGDWKFIKN